MVAGSTPRFWRLWHVSSRAWSRVVPGQRTTGTTRWERTPPPATPLWFFSTKVSREVNRPCCSLSIRCRNVRMAFTGQEPPPVVMVDELLILNPHKLSFSDASMRIMITPHFSPRTRLSMAGRMVISEVLGATWPQTGGGRELPASRGVVLQRQRLIQRKNQADSEAGPGFTANSLKRMSPCGLENGGRGPGEDAESGGMRGAQTCQAEEEEDEDGIFSPVRIPGDKAAPTNLCCDWLILVHSWPCRKIERVSRAPPAGGLWEKTHWIAQTYSVFNAGNASSALCRWMLCTCEVGDHMAFGHPSLLHGAQLRPAALAPLVHGYLCGLHPVDRRLLLPHGVDGEDQAGATRSEKASAGFCPNGPLSLMLQVTIISHTLDIPDYIMGITFLAAGTSVPDCMASLIVARQGNHPPLSANRTCAHSVIFDSACLPPGQAWETWLCPTPSGAISLTSCWVWGSPGRCVPS